MKKLQIKPLSRSAKTGFSFIEMAVIVAILGLLMAIIVPNYYKFLARNRQSEAKTSLFSLYIHQKNFRREYGTFHENLPYIGFIPDGVAYETDSTQPNWLCPLYSDLTLWATRYYWIGFAPSAGTGPAARNYIVAGQPSMHCGSTTSTSYYTATHPNSVSQGENFSASTSVSRDNFLAEAYGVVLSPAVDVWRIDETKAIDNVSAGY